MVPTTIKFRQTAQQNELTHFVAAAAEVDEPSNCRRMKMNSFALVAGRSSVASVSPLDAAEAHPPVVVGVVVVQLVAVAVVLH